MCLVVPPRPFAVSVHVHAGHRVENEGREALLEKLTLSNETKYIHIPFSISTPPPELLEGSVRVLLSRKKLIRSNVSRYRLTILNPILINTSILPIYAKLHDLDSTTQSHSTPHNNSLALYETLGKKYNPELSSP